jgi:hypothetical protein
MANKRLDGIIEAVRYSADGKIALVRVYERHGAVWSDHVLLERNALTEQLKQGKRYMIGERKILLGGVFNTGSAVREMEGTICTEGQSGAHDLLTGVPVF